MAKNLRQLSVLGGLSAVLLTCFLNGCVTLESLKSNPYSQDKKIARYLQKHPDRPEDIKAALLKSSLCKGMTPEEVLLCWGKPDRKKASDNDREVWEYFDVEKGGIDADHGSSIFDYRVPLGDAVFEFGPSGDVLVEWTVYGDESASSKEQSEEKPEPVQPKAITPAVKPAVVPAVTPDVDMSQWPSLQVTGVMTSGAKQGAIINDTFVMVGDSIDEVTLLMVTERGVYMRYRNQTTLIQRTPEPKKKGLFKK